MTGLLRQLFGFIIIAALAAVFFVLVTAASRSRLDAMVAESEKVSKAESALLVRLAENLTGQNAKMALPADLIWQGDDAAAVEIAIQKQILDAANQSEVQVMAFGAASPAEGVAQATIGYEVELEGGHVEIARFLAALEQVRPGLAIATLWMRQLPPIEGVAKAPVSLRLMAWGFRSTDGGTQ